MVTVTKLKDDKYFLQANPGCHLIRKGLTSFLSHDLIEFQMLYCSEQELSEILEVSEKLDDTGQFLLF